MYWNVILGFFMSGANTGIKLMYQSIRDEQQMEELKQQNMQAEMDYLKYQINPHFFMNTLNNIHSLIDIDAAEAPIMDGSAREYAEKIVETGLIEQDADRKYYQVTEKMVYTIPDKGVSIILYPDEEFSASVHVDYNSKVIGNQYATFNPGDNFADKIAPCRTFVFLHELEPLMKMNLIKGGDLDNAIVVVENPVSDEQLTHLKQIFHKEDICITGGYLNNLELRFTNELARHKLLDLLGDLALLGMRINIRTGEPIIDHVTGGVSGPAVLPMGLVAVWKTRSALPNTPIIGIGGIDSGEKALEYLYAGANAVEVGAAALFEPTAPLRVARELDELLDARPELADKLAKGETWR